MMLKLKVFKIKVNFNRNPTKIVVVQKKNQVDRKHSWALINFGLYSRSYTFLELRQEASKP